MLCCSTLYALRVQRTAGAGSPSQASKVRRVPVVWMSGSRSAAPLASAAVARRASPPAPCPAELPSPGGGGGVGGGGERHRAIINAVFLLSEAARARDVGASPRSGSLRQGRVQARRPFPPPARPEGLDPWAGAEEAEARLGLGQGTRPSAWPRVKDPRHGQGINPSAWPRDKSLGVGSAPWSPPLSARGRTPGAEGADGCDQLSGASCCSCPCGGCSSRARGGRTGGSRSCAAAVPRAC